MTPTTATILSLFATIWWVVGFHAAHAGSPLRYGVGAMVSLTLIAFASRRHIAPLGAAEDARRGRIIGVASGVEGVAIVVAINLCRNLGRSDLIAPAIAVIVGLHFVPLALGFPARAYLLPAAALVALGPIGAVAIPDGERRTLVISAGAALILWLASAYALMQSEARHSPS